jgi:hypothetical protein
MCFCAKQCPVELYLCSMRKRWTPKEKEEVTPALLKFREKRKWAINLRRYVIEGSKCPYYAPYFGLDTKSFKEWIELQFDSTPRWNSFASEWQFDHIVPVNYFDFRNEEDMRLCWNFINIRVEKIDHNRGRGNRIDVIAAKSFFEKLFEETGLQICRQMVEKIERIEVSQIVSNKKLEDFIIRMKPQLEKTASYTAADFERLNLGLTVDQIEYEREFLKKFK